MATLRTAQRSGVSPGWAAVLMLIGLMALAVVLPARHQDGVYHAFADTRTWAGIPNAANVLSNVVLMIAGLIAMRLRPIGRDPRGSRATATAFATFAAGVMLTSVGSAWYHLAPTDRSLVLDRLPMTIAFAGILGAAFAERTSAAAGATMLAGLLIIGPASVLFWAITGNVTPYAVVQAGAIAILVALLVVTREAHDPYRWWALLAFYALAKVAEMLDAPIFAMTHQTVSGHTVKHVLSGIAAGAPFWTVMRRRRR